MSKRYLVNFGWGDAVEVRKSQFDQLRGMSRLFKWKPNRPERLSLKTDLYLAWKTETGDLHFHEKISRREVGRLLRSPEDSCVKVEKRCAAQDPRYIRDDLLRQLEIQKDYA